MTTVRRDRFGRRGRDADRMVATAEVSASVSVRNDRDCRDVGFVVRCSLLCHVVGKVASGHLPGKNACGRDALERIISTYYSTPE